MKILFFYRGVESLGVGTLMSVMRAEGHQVGLLFDPGLDDNLYVRAPALAFLNRWERLARHAAAFAPDLVAFSSTSNLFPAVSRFMRRLRESVRAPFVIGGIHATVLPEYVLEHTPADYACVGEGELPLAQLARALEQGVPADAIPGLCVRRGGGFHGNPPAPPVLDLDALPFPDKLPFFRAGCFRTRLSVMTSRGCPYHCRYCSNDVYFQLHGGPSRGVRRRSPEHVMEELRLLKRTYPVRSFWFCDDVFAAHRPWLEEFARQYEGMGALPFDCHLHPNAVDPGRIRLLRRAGCRHIFLGVDSGDDRIRREIMGRPVSRERIREAVRLIRQAGIRLTISAIFGLPGEGPAEMRRTLDLCTGLAADGTSAYIFYPFFGTRLFDDAREKGLLTAEGVEKVKRGEGSYHHESVLDHPHKKLADTYSKLTPVYARAGRPVRRLLDLLIRRRAFRAAALLYVAFAPLTFPVVGLSWLADTVRMARKAGQAP